MKLKLKEDKNKWMFSKGSDNYIAKACQEMFVILLDGVSTGKISPVSHTPPAPV